MTKKVVTLDIDSNSIRLLEVKGDAVTRWAAASLEHGESEVEGALDPKALGAKVKQLMNSSGIKADKVIVGVSGLYSMSRIMTVPKAPFGQSTEDIVLETASDTMPLSGDRQYFLWQTVATGDNTQKVLAVGVPRDRVDNEASALKTVGISPYIMELRAIALARAVNREQAIILDIGFSSSDIVIMVDSIPQVMHTIAVHESNLTTEDWVEYFARNLEMIVDFYNSKYSDTIRLDSATPVYITGQMTDNASFMKKLRATLGYRVESLAPPLQCPESLPVSEYAVNIGLALRETTPSQDLQTIPMPPIKINFLPESYQPWRPSARQLYPVIMVLLSLSLIFPLFNVTQQAMGISAKAESRYTVLSNELLRRQMEIKKREPLQQAISEYNIIKNRGGNFTGDLDTIKTEAAKLGITIESISHKGGSIAVLCLAAEGDYLAFREYKAALENSGRFATPIPPPEGYPFTWRGTIRLEPAVSE